MDKLYPIIRRVRRPLIPVAEAVPVPGAAQAPPAVGGSSENVKPKPEEVRDAAGEPKP
jgi:hypothetical protein